MINLRILFVLLLMLVCTPSVVTAQTTKEDTLSTHLLNEVKKYFNSDNETAFYQASAQYREYYLNRNDLNNYYQGWEHEILYDVNHKLLPCHAQDNGHTKGHAAAQGRKAIL